MKRVLFGIAVLILIGCSQPTEPDEHAFRANVTGWDDNSAFVEWENLGTVIIDAGEINVGIRFTDGIYRNESVTFTNMSPGSVRDYTFSYVLDPTDPTVEYAYVQSWDLDWEY